MASPDPLFAVAVLVVFAASAIAQKEVTPIVRTPDAAASARRQAMQNIALALAVPTTDANDPQAGLLTEADMEAIAHFRSATTTATGFELLVATAAASPPFVARRAFVALRDAHMVGNPARTIPLLLAAIDHPDPIVAATAMPVLARCTRYALPPELRASVVAAGVAVWPKDMLTLQWIAPETSSPTHPAWGAIDPAHKVFRLVAIAVGTGDRSLIDRLVPPPGAKAPDPKDDRYPHYSWFVRNCLARAAPNVDDDTSRMLCSWFLPAASDRTHNQNDQHWAELALDVLFGVYCHAPADLHPNFSTLLQNRDANNGFRRRLKSHPVPEAQLRLLLRPLEAEFDRDLVLAFPDYVATAIAGTEAQRKSIVDLLQWKVWVQDNEPRVGQTHLTAAHWRAMLEVLDTLPAAERVDVLGYMFQRDHLANWGIDVQPAMLRACVERDAARKRMAR